MVSYWDTVPRGIWKIIEPVDVLAVLGDSETTWVTIPDIDRVHIFGPAKKALILDLEHFREFKHYTEYSKCMKLLGLKFA